MTGGVSRDYLCLDLKKPEKPRNRILKHALLSSLISSPRYLNQSPSMSLPVLSYILSLIYDGSDNMYL